jgi:hypothetical protein
MYYYQVIWKDFSRDPLIVTQKVGEYLQAQRELPEDKQIKLFTYQKAQYELSSISSVEPTTKKVISTDQKQLYAGGMQLKKRVPLINEDGDVVTAWYKKFVTTKEFENYYAKSHNYYTVEKDGAGVWVGFRKVMMENDDIPVDIEPCTEAEAERLWKYVTHS